MENKTYTHSVYISKLYLPVRNLKLFYLHNSVEGQVKKLTGFYCCLVKKTIENIIPILPKRS